MVFVVSWQFIPFHTLIYQGAVRQIPESMYEAAKIDGAGRVRQFFSITLPQLKNTIITSSTLMVVGSLTFFDIIFVLTQGGPADATTNLALLMYKKGFQANLMGQASVIAVIIVLLGLALALLLRRLGGRDTTAARSKAPDMATATLETRDSESAPGRIGHRRTVRRLARFNWLGGVAAWIWFVIVMLPIYWIVITSLKTQDNYFATNPLVPPSNPTLENYRLVLRSDFVRYFVNSVIVTVGAVVPAVVVSFMAAYAIIRDHHRWFLRGTNSMFLMGLAIPLQATIIPIYLMIIKLKLYDTLLALILPSIAFAIPLSVLVLANFIRDVPDELFESMRVDGASDWAMLWRLAFPLTRPALLTVTIYNALTVWNGFLCCRWCSPRPRTNARCRWRCGPSRASTASTSRPFSRRCC